MNRPDSDDGNGFYPPSSSNPREDRAALFPYGYGLSLDESKSDHMGIDASGFELTERRLPAAMPLMVARLRRPNPFGRLADDEFKMYISGNANRWQGVSTSRGTRSTIPGVSTYPMD